MRVGIVRIRNPVIGHRHERQAEYLAGPGRIFLFVRSPERVRMRKGGGNDTIAPAPGFQSIWEVLLRLFPWLTLLGHPYLGKYLPVCEWQSFGQVHPFPPPGKGEMRRMRERCSTAASIFLRVFRLHANAVRWPRQSRPLRSRRILPAALSRKWLTSRGLRLPSFSDAMHSFAPHATPAEAAHTRSGRHLALRLAPGAARGSRPDWIDESDKASPDRPVEPHATLSILNRIPAISLHATSVMRPGMVTQSAACSGPDWP